MSVERGHHCTRRWCCSPQHSSRTTTAYLRCEHASGAGVHGVSSHCMCLSLRTRSACGPSWALSGRTTSWLLPSTPKQDHDGLLTRVNTPLLSPLCALGGRTGGCSRRDMHMLFCCGPSRELSGCRRPRRPGVSRHRVSAVLKEQLRDLTATRQCSQHEHRPAVDTRPAETSLPTTRSPPRLTLRRRSRALDRRPV